MGLERMLLELESLRTPKKVSFDYELDTEAGSLEAIRTEEYNIALLDVGFLRKIPFVLNGDIVRVVKEVYDASVDAGSNAFNFFKWVVGNITYGERKRGKKGYRNSVEVFEDREGVCGEMSVLYLAMVRAIGIRGSYVHVDVDYKGKNVNHACAMLDLKGREGFNILVDPAYREYDIRHRSFTPLTDFEAYKYFNAH